MFWDFVCWSATPKLAKTTLSFAPPFQTDDSKGPADHFKEEGAVVNDNEHAVEKNYVLKTIHKWFSES